MKKFIGRKSELLSLLELRKKNSASLVVCKGRRRIGKSRLIREFGKSFECYIEIQGLAPVKGQTNQDQIDNFIDQLKRQTNLPNVKVETWGDAFDLLASLIKDISTLILLDEISWMGQHDRNFTGQLKIFWDNIQNQHEKLILCLCGSVSTWIQENILNSTHFVGRISLALTLRELEIAECREFFEATKRSNISSAEKLRYLCVTGGVPKYLEEINLNESFEKNINRLAFIKHGFLYLEFSNLFSNSFEKEKDIYRQIIGILEKRNLSLSEITSKLGKHPGGNYGQYLSHLEQAGFVKKDVMWNLRGEKSKATRYRVSDNYTRFYFRCIKPKVNQIEQGIDNFVKFEDWSNWRSLLGLQFENLVNANLNALLNKLEITPGNILSIGPYIQNKSTKNKGGCQIDLVILTKFDTAYICEIKFKKELGLEVVSEVRKKIGVLQKPKYFSVRPVLIYAGELSEDLECSDYFYKKIDFTSFL